jgi:hypothetical protein
MLTAEQKLKLGDIHREVFDNFEYISDAKLWATPDYWVTNQDIITMTEIGEFKGDCDDFALIIRYFCREHNIPSQLLFCWVPNGNPPGYHLATYFYGYYSDCNHPFIMHQNEVNMIPISLSGFEKGEPWHYVKSFDYKAPWPHQR